MFHVVKQIVTTCGCKKISSHSHKSGSWYFSGVLFKPQVHLYGITPPGVLHWMLVVFFNNQEEQKTILQDFITLKTDML